MAEAYRVAAFDGLNRLFWAAPAGGL